MILTKRNCLLHVIAPSIFHFFFFLFGCSSTSSSGLLRRFCLRVRLRLLERLFLCRGGRRQSVRRGLVGLLFEFFPELLNGALEGSHSLFEAPDIHPNIGIPGEAGATHIGGGSRRYYLAQSACLWRLHRELLEPMVTIILWRRSARRDRSGRIRDAAMRRQDRTVTRLHSGGRRGGRGSRHRRCIVHGEGLARHLRREEPSR